MTTVVEPKPFNITDKEVRTLALTLLKLITWRGYQPVTEFDEYYHTKDYILYQDNSSDCYVSVKTREGNNKILSYNGFYERDCSFSGTEQDYHNLWQIVANHDELLSLRQERMGA